MKELHKSYLAQATCRLCKRMSSVASMSDSFEAHSFLSPEFFDHYASGYEAGRLQSGTSQIELARTQELVMRYVPPLPAVIFDVGGGPGVYACSRRRVKPRGLWRAHSYGPEPEVHAPLLVPADCGTIHRRTACTTHHADISCRLPGEKLDAL